MKVDAGLNESLSPLEFLFQQRQAIWICRSHWPKWPSKSQLPHTSLRNEHGSPDESRVAAASPTGDSLLINRRSLNEHERPFVAVLRRFPSHSRSRHIYRRAAGHGMRDLLGAVGRVSRQWLGVHHKRLETAGDVLRIVSLRTKRCFSLHGRTPTASTVRCSRLWQRGHSQRRSRPARRTAGFFRGQNSVAARLGACRGPWRGRGAGDVPHFASRSSGVGGNVPCGPASLRAILRAPSALPGVPCMGCIYLSMSTVGTASSSSDPTSGHAQLSCSAI
jgi:hypothetical protein